MNLGIDVIDFHISGINFANCFCCSVIISVVLTALLLKKVHTSEIRAFIFFSFFAVAAMWTDFIGYMCSGNVIFIMLNYIINICSYAFSALAACSFHTYILAYFEERKGTHYKLIHRVGVYVYAVLCTAVYASSVWTGAFFYVDSENIYRGTELSFVTGSILTPIVIASIYIIIKNRKLTSKRDTLIHLMYNLTYIVLGFIDSLYVLTFHYIVMTVFIVLIFIFIGQERDKELETKQKELAISELNALRLQMNPHFIYNTWPPLMA